MGTQNNRLNERFIDHTKCMFRLLGEKIITILRSNILLKDKDYCPIEIIKGLTDKGQFQYLIKLMGPQEGTYLYATQFHSLR